MERDQRDHKHFSTGRQPVVRWMLGGLLFFLLACNLGTPLAGEMTSTPISDMTRFEVQVRLASPTPILFELTPGPTIVALAITPLVTSTLTTAALDTSPTATLEPRPTGIPLSQPASPLIPTNTPSPAEAEAGDGVYTGNITGQIVLLGPDPGFTLPPELDQLEFKWQWLGEELRPCQLPEGFGFEIRIWPSPANAQIPEAQRSSVQPLGVIDALEEQETIAGNCDPKTGFRRYTVNYLKQTPGVALSQGSGHFFWDVAYIQLEPYYVPLMVSAPQDFFIPSTETEVATPTPSPTTTPMFQLEPGPKPAGTITLIAPEGKPVFPANVGPVEFRWKWEGQDSGPCQMADGYGFELSVGSAQSDFPRLGVVDAVKAQDQFACDPGSGIYSFTVLDLKGLAGVKATYMGEYRWDGQFVWEVALVSLRPYQPPGPDSTAQQSYFEISLGKYTGSLDPSGAPLTCEDFSGWTEAQAVFLAAGGPGKDPHKLDEDGNQIACDALRQ